MGAGPRENTGYFWPKIKLSEIEIEFERNTILPIPTNPIRVLLNWKSCTRWRIRVLLNKSCCGCRKSCWGWKKSCRGWRKSCTMWRAD